MSDDHATRLDRWSELVGDVDARQLRAMVRSMTDACYVALSRGVDVADTPAARRDAVSLYRGWAGFALLASELSLLDETRVVQAREAIGHVIHGVEAVAPELGSVQGLSGLALSVHHFQSVVGDDFFESLSSFDRLLLSAYDSRRPLPDFDLAIGTAGLGLYGVVRLPESAARLLMDRVVEDLSSGASRSPEGLRWPYSSEIAEEEATRGPFVPNRHCGLGLAHGSAGVVGILAGALRRGYRRELASGLLSDAITFIGNKYLATASDRNYSWCWGNLGVATQIVYAGLSCGEKGWYELGLEMARQATTYEVGARDACLCHGSAGAMHMFNRLWQSTGEPVFRDAALRWLDLVLKQKHAGSGIDGYLFEIPPGGVYGGTPGFLHGLVGVALALLSAISPVEPKWDWVLLMSAAPPICSQRQSDHE